MTPPLVPLASGLSALNGMLRLLVCLLCLTLSLRAIDAPTLSAPADNAAGIVQHPSFLWSAVSGATAYEIQIADDSSFATLVASDTVEIPRFVPATPLSPQTKYWRVRSLDSLGTPSAWTTAFTYQLSAPANTYTISATATLADMQTVFNTAAANAPALVSFAAGATYTVNPTGVAALNLMNASNVIVDGNGCSFLIQNPSAAFMRLDGSSKITVKNFYVDYDPLPHFVGILEGLSGSTLTLRRQPGYPALNSTKMVSNFSQGSILDKNHRGWLKPYVKIGYSFTKSTIAATSDPDVFTIALTTAADAKDFELGDPVVMWARENSQALFRSMGSGHGKDITYYNITSYASPTAHYLNNDTSDVKVLGCHSLKKDATRWLAGNADGVHTKSNPLGPWIENCSFEGIGDDSVAIYNKGLGVSSQLGNTSVRVLGTYFDLEVGDSFVIFNPRDGVTVGGTYTVTGVTASGSNYDVSFTPSLGSLTLTGGQTDVTLNDQFFNLSRRNKNFMVRNCLFDGVRRYGSIIRSCDGVIRNNVYQGATSAAVMIRNEATTWANGLFSERVLVKNNTIADCGFDRGNFVRQLGAITVRITTTNNDAVPVTAASRLHQSITVADNNIKNWHQRAISLENAVNCIVDNNTIWSDSTARADDSYYGIYVNNTDSAQITDNDLSGEVRPLIASVSVTANNTTPFSDGNTAAPHETMIVKDNSDSDGITVTGTWTAATSASWYYGSNYLYASSTGTNSVRYTPTIPVAGTYDVYLRWTENANRASNAPVDIVYAGGTQTVSVNEQTNGGAWVLLGTFAFDAGTTGSVLVRNTGANGFVVADAVKFVAH